MFTANNMVRFFVLIISLVGYFNTRAQEFAITNLKTGDLLFQNLDCGDMCDAIEAVTRGWKNKDYTHVGIVQKNNNSIYIMESMGPGVRKVLLDDFKKRSAHPILVARVKNKYKALIPKAVSFANKEMGLPYDDEFLINNKKYYCSELVYEAFKNANGGRPFFKLKPMTYKQPGSKKYFPVWQTYYAQLQKPIPQGKPGCNPGGLSRSARIKILGEL